MDHVIESGYPLTFREKEAQKLGQHLKNRHCVVLIGMKRVGISNFLRFFLYHKDIASTYIADGHSHLFIPVDLNDLVETELFPFWTLTLKRIVDTVSKSTLPKNVKKDIETLFLDSIQSQDLFLTIDSVRQSLVKIVDSGMLPTVFLLRFDRLRNAVTPQFFANLQGLIAATHEKLSYVFTSFRSLDSMSPLVFTKTELSRFSYDMYVKPGATKDIQIIFDTYKKRYKLRLTPSVEQDLLDIVDGYTQYVQYALVSLHEQNRLFSSKDELFEFLIKDERISLQSEELWESLSLPEQTILLKVSKQGRISKEEREKGRYIWDTGMVEDIRGKQEIFSSVFAYFLKQQEKKSAEEVYSVEFTKKENLLFKCLLGRLNTICEREAIIEAVWPEVEALGVSDWAIDRLVARVRSKLKMQKAMYGIQTIRTRGYKLIPK